MTVRSLASPPPKGDLLSSRERKRLETRARLFEAALEEFRSVGFQSAQIDRIVEKVGVARGTFYFHFPTKEHVLLEAQRKSEGELVERLRAYGAAPANVGEFLKRVYGVIRDSMDEDPKLRREILAMYIRAPMHLELANEPLIVEVVDYFADAIERGAVRDDLQPEQLAVHFLGSLFGLLAGDDARIQSSDGIADFDLAVDIFLNGVSR